MDIIEKTGRGLRELALFAGAGGGILGGKMLGWRTVCAVEIDPYCQSVLCQRQNEGLLEVFPIWDDVCTFDGKAWKGYVDVISGGFPCQDISVANIEGAGLEGERSGLWKEMRRIVSEIRPQWVFVENSPMLVHRGLDRVLGDLAELGYDAEYGIMGADDVGASHERQRMWILAGAISDPSSARCEQQESSTGEHSGEGQSNVRDDDSVFPDTSSEIMERFGGRKSRDEQTRYASADNSEAVSEPEGTESRDGTDTVGGDTYESWTDWTDFFLHGRGKYANKGGGNTHGGN